MTRAVPVLALALGACAVPIEASPRDADVDLPEHWASAETDDGAPLEHWWTTFGDQRLVAAVQEALVQNRDLQAAAARLDAALANATIAGADSYPQIGANLDAGRSRVNFIGLPFPGSQGGVTSITTSSYGVSLDLSWELDLWGRIRAGKMAAHSDVEAAAADLRGARLSIAAQTSKAWFAVVELHLQLELARQTTEIFRRTAELVRNRFENGVRPALDLRLALSDLAAAEALLDQREQQHRAAVRQLQVLIGRYPDGSLMASEELPSVGEKVPAGLPSELLTRRPDLVAAERRLASSDALLAQARAELYPRISLTASGGTSSNDLKDIADFDFSVWSLGANLFAPIFQGGRLRANVSLHDAFRKESVAEYGGAVLRALREVETNLSAEELLELEETHRAMEVEQSQAARRLSDDRYRRGLDNIITLLAAQRRAVESEIQLLDLRRRRLDTRVDLLLALGGGFGDTPATPVEEQP